MFIRHALVQGEWQTRHRFLGENARLRAELKELEDRARRHDLLVGDDEVHSFYDARIPAEAVSARHFDGWWKRQRHQTPDLLNLRRDDLLCTDVGGSADRPDSWQAGDVALPLTYRFEPGATDDGVTVHVPIDVLTRLGADEFAWQIPALREELITALIRSLPKQLRRNLVPVPDTARAVLASIEPAGEPLLGALQRELRRRTGVVVPTDAFDLDKLPPHLRVSFAVHAGDGREVARGKDLNALQAQLAAPARDAVADAVAGELERTDLRGWPDDLDELPPVVERTVADRPVRGFPAFVDNGVAVDLRVFATPAEQDCAMRPGIRRLLRLLIASPVKSVERQIDRRTRLALSANPDGSWAALLDDCVDAAIDALVAEPVWTRADFAALRVVVAAGLPATTLDIVSRVEQVLSAVQAVHLALPVQPPPGQAEAVADVRAQLDRLLPRGFITAAGWTRLPDLTRYLVAVRRRLDRLPHAIEADQERMQRVHAVQNAYHELLHDLSARQGTGAEARDIAWQIEELRVSLWAQQLGTPRPVSEQRIYRAIEAAR
jgi:ATP-dependent helicase HrpA